MSIPQNKHIHHTNSYYAATINEPAEFPALLENIESDVCIIGAGFTGINTAINLAEKGFDVVVIESAKVGWGASGRNGGQLISGFTFSPKLSKIMDDEAVQSVWELGAKSADLVRERIQEHQIECDLKSGFIEVALNKIQMQELVERKENWEKRGYQHQLTLVDESEIRNYVGSARYIGGLIDSGSGHLHPLNLCLGEAKVATNLGVRIFEQSRAIAIDFGKTVITKTNKGIVKSKYLVVAGNAYIGALHKSLRRMIMPANSCIIATESLSDEVANEILPKDMAVCDLNTILDYYRLSPDKRLLFGGRWNYSGNEPKNIKGNLRKRMLKVFPDFDKVKIDYGWGGNVAVSLKRIPQLGKLTDNVFYSQGYSGHGVAPTHMAAEIVASAISKEWDMLDLLSQVKHIQLPGGKWFASPAMAMGMVYYRLQDFIANRFTTMARKRRSKR